MKIKDVALTDLDALEALHVRCFDPHDRWSREQILGSLNMETTIGFVGLEGDTPLAFVIAQRVQGETEILSLAVAPESRRKGIGTALLNALFEAVTGDSVFLEVAADNEAARCLYESAGFTIFSKRESYYRREAGRVDALIYRRAG